ncbi:hypothetical protein BT96DRAFT_1011375 [Gymnopus androsaceus JB14]|uniref:Uncharacterized protein n=1 Tax=Gymnopus androsaceus JB14 TaxID=1447944 RepID=A0A6A4ILU0_9AGAR|nr:hypothetical protein BT96DRAFT_1011375 [Gymnopus androsaceus JB14]
MENLPYGTRLKFLLVQTLPTLRHFAIINILVLSGFNPIEPSLLSSGGIGGEGLKDPSKPYTPTPGGRSTKLDEITSVAWNRQVQYVLAGARPSCSSSSPMIMAWDLQNARAPEFLLKRRVVLILYQILTVAPSTSIVIVWIRGKLVSVSNVASSQSGSQSRSIHLHNVVTEANIVERVQMRMRLMRHCFLRIQAAEKEYPVAHRRVVGSGNPFQPEYDVPLSFHDASLEESILESMLHRRKWFRYTYIDSRWSAAAHNGQRVRVLEYIGHILHDNNAFWHSTTPVHSSEDNNIFYLQQCYASNRPSPPPSQ